MLITELHPGCASTAQWIYKLQHVAWNFREFNHYILELSSQAGNFENGCMHV